MSTATAPKHRLPAWLIETVMNLVEAAYEAGMAAAQAIAPPAPPPSVAVQGDTLSRPEAARFLRMGLTKFDLLVANGEIDFTFKIGGLRFARRADLQAWLDRQADAGSSPP